MNHTKVIYEYYDDTISTKTTTATKVLTTTIVKSRKKPRRKLQLVREVISKNFFKKSFLKNRICKSDDNHELSLSLIASFISQNNDNYYETNSSTPFTCSSTSSSQEQNRGIIPDNDTGNSYRKVCGGHYLLASNNNRDVDEDDNRDESSELSRFSELTPREECEKPSLISSDKNDNDNIDEEGCGGVQSINETRDRIVNNINNNDDEGEFTTDTKTRTIIITNTDKLVSLNHSSQDVEKDNDSKRGVESGGDLTLSSGLNFVSSEHNLKNGMTPENNSFSVNKIISDNNSNIVTTSKNKSSSKNGKDGIIMTNKSPEKVDVVNDNSQGEKISETEPASLSAFIDITSPLVLSALEDNQITETESVFSSSPIIIVSSKCADTVDLHVATAPLLKKRISDLTLYLDDEDDNGAYDYDIAAAPQQIMSDVSLFFDDEDDIDDDVEFDIGAAPQLNISDLSLFLDDEDDIDDDVEFDIAAEPLQRISDSSLFFDDEDDIDDDFDYDYDVDVTTLLKMETTSEVSLLFADEDNIKNIDELQQLIAKNTTTTTTAPTTPSTAEVMEDNCNNNDDKASTVSALYISLYRDLCIVPCF